MKKSFQLYRLSLSGCFMTLILILGFQPMTGFTQVDSPASKGVLGDELLENISLLSEVLARIQQEHLDTPDSKQLMYGAIRGMLRTLDPYSQFFGPKSFDYSQKVSITVLRLQSKNC